jgi:uncharacterized membrane protein YkgB
MNNDTYKKWHGLDHQFTWREVLGTIAIIAIILFIVGFIDSL